MAIRRWRGLLVTFLAPLMIGCADDADPSVDRQACDIIGEATAAFVNEKIDRAALITTELRALPLDEIEDQELEELMVVAAAIGVGLNRFDDTEKLQAALAVVNDADSACIDKGLS